MNLKTYHKISGNATIMSWINQFITVGSSLFVLPLLLKKFDEIEISFWFLINIFIQLTMLADSGFGPTMIRAVSYFRAGAAKLPLNKRDFDILKDGLNKPNLDKLLDLLFTSKRIYEFVGWGAVLLISTIGVLISWNIFSLANFRNDFIASYILIVINSYLILQIVRWNSFMAGLNYVAKASEINAYISLLRLFSYVIILILTPSVLYLIIFNVLSSIIILILYRRFIVRWFLQRRCNLLQKRKFNKEIFQSIWSATWRMGGIQWGNYLINYGTSIIVAQLNNPTLISNFLFTQRILFILRRVSEVPFFANIPLIYGFIVKKKYNYLKIKVSKYIFLAIFILTSSFILIALLGNSVLAFLDIDTRLIPFKIFFILFIAILFDIHSAIHRTIYISTNHIPFLIPILVSGVIILILGFIIVPYYGLLGIVSVQLLVQLSFNYWFPVILSFRLVDWRLIKYIKDLYKYGYVVAMKQVKDLIIKRIRGTTLK